MFIEPFLKYTWKRPNRLINILNWFCNRDQNQFNMKKNAIFISKTLGRLLNKCFTYSLLPLSPTQQYLKDFFHHYGISDRPVRTERKKKQNALSFWWPPSLPPVVEDTDKITFFWWHQCFLTKPPKSQIPLNSPQLKGSESREVDTWCLSWCLINVPTMCSTCSLEVAGNLRDIRIATELREMWVKVCRRRETSPN